MNNTIRQCHYLEGRILNPLGTPNYEYSPADHLGNSRVTFDSNGGAVAKQVDDYYPFGLEINRSTTSPKNEYLYNRKELQEETGQYDYGARFYDPVVDRWTSVDPLPEKSRRFSPYTYGDDNSIRNINPDGMETEGCCGTPILFPAAVGFAKSVIKAVTALPIMAMNFVDGENSQRSFSKDPAIRAEAKQELKAAATAVVAVITDGIVGRVANALNGTGPKIEVKDGLNISEAYKQPNNATTLEQRESVQGQPCATCGVTSDKMVADHKTPLVQEYYETGTIDKNQMKSKDAVQPQCATCSVKQGAEMSKYSKEQKKVHGFN